MKTKLANMDWKKSLATFLYDKSPRLAGNLISLSCAALCHSHLHKLSYLEYRKYVNFLKKSQWWSKEKLEEYQTERLKPLIKNAYENVPYYKVLFQKEGIKPSQIRCLEDLQNIPILDKETVAKNFKRLISKKYRYSKLYESSTSGTTGTPLKVVYPKDYVPFLSALRDRHHSYNGSKFYQTSVQFGGSITSEMTYEDGLKWRYNPVERALYFSASNMIYNILKEYVSKIKEYKPSFIRGTGSAVYQLALFLKENKIKDIRFDSFTNKSEMLLEHQKNLIKKQMGCEVYNFYSQVEEVCSAMDCSKHEGLHVDMEKGIVEIIKHKPGQKTGQLVATCLQNQAMPLIRYETGDVASISKKQCICGRGLMLLDSFEGRKDDVININGKIISPPEFSLTLKGIINVKECQFVQKKENDVLIRIVTRVGYGKKDEKQILENSHKLLGKDASIRIEHTNEIKRTRRGKFRFVISDRRT